MSSVSIGMVAGLVGTAPMTAVMKLIHVGLPQRQRQIPIPPHQVTMAAMEMTGVKAQMNERARAVATVVSHFAYGAAAGGVYAAVEGRLPGGPAKKGVIFGLGVWAGSYLGWLPAAGVLPPATRWPAGRNLMMILSHVVWGVSTAVVTGALVARNRPAARR